MMKRKHNCYTIEVHLPDGDIIDYSQTMLHKSLSKIYSMPFWEYNKITLREATHGKLLEVDNQGNVCNYIGKGLNLKSRHIGRVETYKQWRK